MLGGGLILGLVTLLVSLKTGAKAPPNPWGGKSLEWETASPPITENFKRTPLVTHGPYDFDTTEEK